MEDRLPESLAWWEKAADDVDAARILIREKGPGFAIGFHMQQAVEKALKALLTLHNIKSPRTHDLEILANLAMFCLPSLSQYTRLRARLNEYAVINRYPGDAPEVANHELEEWFRETEELLTKIESVLYRTQDNHGEGSDSRS